jgi:Holliday junction resolvasome RuvABC ATP-dependent DNA helicase subunit
LEEKESSDSEGELVTLLDFETIEISLPTSKSAKKAPRLAITLDNLKKEIKDGEFIQSFFSSAKAFLQYKTTFYAEKLKEVEQEYARVSAKVKKLQDDGVDRHDIKDLYPMYASYSGFILQLKDVIDLVSNRAKSLTPTTLKANLLRAINHTKKGFASTVGRDNIKNHLAAVLYSFSKSHKSLIGAFNNICLMGNAGVGKTAVAKVIGYVFSKSGLLATNSVKIVSRSDLVKGWVGGTAPNVRAILFESLEGVLFIDEVYGLTPLDPGRDSGPEAMTEIVNFLDKYIGMNVTIVAGYTRLMKMTFFPSNEGLARRFPIVMELKDYSNRELVNILVRFINSKRDQKLDSKTCNYLYSLVISLKKEYPMIFKGQAGDMLNLGTAIVKSINASFRKPWKEGRLENNKEIIMEAVREYADLKEIKWNDSAEESKEESEEDSEEDEEGEDEDLEEST